MSACARGLAGRRPARLERPLRYLVSTPGLHRVHHSTRPEETDSNFSAVFRVWDLVFGTFRTLPAEVMRERPLGLATVRDARTRSVPWLLAVPARSLTEETPAVSYRSTPASSPGGRG